MSKEQINQDILALEASVKLASTQVGLNYAQLHAESEAFAQGLGTLGENIKICRESLGEDVEQYVQNLNNALAVKQAMCSVYGEAGFVPVNFRTLEHKIGPGIANHIQNGGSIKEIVAAIKPQGIPLEMLAQLPVHVNEGQMQRIQGTLHAEVAKHEDHAQSMTKLTNAFGGTPMKKGGANRSKNQGTKHRGTSMKKGNSAGKLSQHAENALAQIVAALDLKGKPRGGHRTTTARPQIDQKKGF